MATEGLSKEERLAKRKARMAKRQANHNKYNNDDYNEEFTNSNNNFNEDEIISTTSSTSRSSLNNMRDVVEKSKVIKNNSNEAKNFERQATADVQKKKEQIVKLFDISGEEDSYYNVEKHLLSGMMYLTYSDNDYKRFTNMKSYVQNSDYFYSLLDSAIYEALIQELEKNYEDYNDDNKNNVDETAGVIDLASINSLIGAQAPDVVEAYNISNGMVYLVELLNLETNSLNIVTNGQLVKKYYNRSLTLNKIVDLAASINIDTTDPDKKKETESQYTEFVRLFNSLIIGDDDNNSLKPATMLADEWLSKIQKLYNGEIVQEGLSLGNYVELNKILGGLRAGQLITIGARPAMGKTAFAINLIEQTLLNDSQFKEEGRKPVVAMFSLEMSAEDILERYASSETQINSQLIRNGDLTPEQLKDLILFANDDTKGFEINDTPNLSTIEIENQLMKLKQKNNNHLDLVVIDYLQLIDGGNGNNRQQEVSKISRDLKKIAKSLEVPVIALVQLSRSLEQRQDKRPMLSDIRESGSIEQDSDIVLFLHRDDYYERTESDEQEIQESSKSNDNGKDSSKMEILIAKNRQGGRGTVDMVFDKARSNFSIMKYKD